MKMAATAAVNRSVPNESGSNGGNLQSCPSSNPPNCGQQDSGAAMSSQDPGPTSHPQQHFPTRPVFYVPAPPPPPFLPFQWPMPFSYNPFSGFPGYGMVLPPFAPPPYVDSPAYILPHPHIQPVDYRRVLHPQVPVPHVPYQNPNHTRRIRLPYTVPVRETVNSAVQTEPTPRRAGRYAVTTPPVRSDSGHGTTSDSPSSSSSSSQKRARANCSLTRSHAKELQALRTCNNGTDKHGGDVSTPHPVHVPSCIGMTVERPTGCTARADQEKVPPYKSSHCNMWSVGSPDGIVPVCTSSQQEDEVKERRVSFPDILMSWGGGTPPATGQKAPDKNFNQNENVEEEEKSVCKSPTICSVALENTGAEDSENVLHARGLSTESRRNGAVDLEESGRRSFPKDCKDLIYSPDMSNEQDHEETILSEEHSEMDSDQMLLSSCGRKRMNESVWSVESIPPFIPPKELMLLKKFADSEIILEMAEEPENDHSGDKSCPNTELQGISSSDYPPASESWLDFASPAQRAASLSKKPEKEPEPTTAGAEPKPGPVLSTVDKNPSVSFTPTAEEAEENRSSEPEANQSPNQEVAMKIADQEPSKRTSPVSVLREVILQSRAEVEAVSGRNDVCVLTSQQRTVSVSPSKGHLVDCATQCRLLPYPQEEPRRHQFKYPDMKNDNGGKAEGFYTSGELQKNKRNGLRKYRGNGRNRW